MNANNLALAATLEHRVADLGNVPLSRILTYPSPGSATIEDVIRVRDEQGKFCELIDGTLVEKAIGYRESILTGVLVQWLWTFCQNTKHGIVTGPDGMFRLFGETIRAPAVAFTSWNRLPGRKIPKEPIPDVTPNIIVEVLRTSNTYGEMSRKRREYFQAGVELLWMVDLRQRTVAVYQTALEVKVYREGEKLNGGAVLPGFEVDSGVLFAKLDQTQDFGGQQKIGP